MYMTVNRNRHRLSGEGTTKIVFRAKANPSTTNVCQHLYTSSNKLTYGSRAVELEVKDVVWRLSPAGDDEEFVQIIIRLRIGFGGSVKN